jgi:predicted amidophosphoribosyltransferase
MFCANCGNQINEGVAFCPQCGTAVGQAAQQQAPVQPAQVPPQAPNNAPKQKLPGPTLILMILSAVAVVILLPLLAKILTDAWSGELGGAVFGLSPFFLVFPILLLINKNQKAKLTGGILLAYLILEFFFSCISVLA